MRLPFGEFARPALVRLPLFAFAAICVFDPADQIFHAKTWMFAATWAGFWILAFLDPDEYDLSPELIVFVLLFISVPLLSTLWYYFANGTEPYAGFGLLKGFLLVSVAIVLVHNRIDLMPFLGISLNLLAILAIIVVAILRLRPDLLETVQAIGSSTGLILVGNRAYAEGPSFTLVNVVTLPLLTLSIPYLFDCALSEPGSRRKAIYLGLVAISVTAMLLSGSRNLAAAALLLLVLLWPLYTRRVVFYELVSLGVLTALSLPLVSRLRASLDPNEMSNNIKLTLLGDYEQIFSDLPTLLFGQGLGAYHRWSTSGRPEFELTGEYFYFNTELTYAELIRYFGLYGAAIIVLILFFPIAKAFLTKSGSRERAIVLGWLAYLCMSATNPMLFSSTGMLFFSVVLAETFRSPTGLNAVRPVRMIVGHWWNRWMRAQ